MAAQPQLQCILPNSYALIRLPNSTLKLVKVIPNSAISLGKFGSFPTNALIYRPYYLTFDIIEPNHKDPSLAGKNQNALRLVPTEEITKEALGDENDAAEEDGAEGEREDKDDEDDDALPMDDSGLDDKRNNRLTIDDPKSQRLSWEEIEEMKKAAGGSGKEIITALLNSHKTLHQKTQYSLFKYTLRKRSKFLKRFTVLPIDIPNFLEYFSNEKEAGKIMEMRNEGLGLMMSLGNIRYCPDVVVRSVNDLGEVKEVRKGARWLVVDETGGLLIVAVAERLGLLDYNPPYLQDKEISTSGQKSTEKKSQLSDDENDGEAEQDESGYNNEDEEQDASEPKRKKPRLDTLSISPSSLSEATSAPEGRKRPLIPASSNTITLVHPNEQPNLSLLKFFHFDPNNPAAAHPLTKHLTTLSYLQLISPSSDLSLIQPEKVTEETFRSWKAGKRSSYLKKWRRWEKIARAVVETRMGGFDGLLIASWMDISGLLAYLGPLVRGSGQIVVWKQEREGLIKIVDALGKEEKAKFLKRPGKEKEEKEEPSFLSNPLEQMHKLIQTLPHFQTNSYLTSPSSTLTSILVPTTLPDLSGSLNPTLFLAPTIHYTNLRKYQVLPGRTHPVMTSRGGSEGYVLAVTRVLPVKGRVDGRGLMVYKNKKRRKGGDGGYDNWDKGEMEEGH